MTFFIVLKFLPKKSNTLVLELSDLLEVFAWRGKNILNWNIEDSRNFSKARGRDLIFPELIFLKLLICDMKVCCYLTLSQMFVLPDFSNSEANFYVMLGCTSWFLFTHRLERKIYTNLLRPVFHRKQRARATILKVFNLWILHYKMGKNLVYKYKFTSSKTGMLPILADMTQLPPEVK